MRNYRQKNMSSRVSSQRDLLSQYAHSVAIACNAAAQRLPNPAWRLQSVMPENMSLLIVSN